MTIEVYISKCNWLHLGQPHRFGKYTIDGTTTITSWEYK